MSKAKELMKAEKDKYALLKFGEEWAAESWISLNSVERKEIPGWIKSNGKLEYNYVCRYYIDNIKISSLELCLPKKVFEVFLPCVYPSEGDMIFATRYMQTFLSYLTEGGDGSLNKYFREADTRANELQQKTLLVDNKELNLTSNANDVEKLYPYKFRSLKYIEVESALKNRDSSVAVVSIARYDTQNSVYFVMNAGTGEIYFYKSSLTFEHGERLGEYAMKYSIFGITSAILSEIATAVK